MWANLCDWKDFGTWTVQPEDEQQQKRLHCVSSRSSISVERLFQCYNLEVPTSNYWACDDPSECYYGQFAGVNQPQPPWIEMMTSSQNDRTLSPPSPKVRTSTAPPAKLHYHKLKTNWWKTLNAKFNFWTKINISFQLQKVHLFHLYSLKRRFNFYPQQAYFSP